MRGDAQGWAFRTRRLALRVAAYLLDVLLLMVAIAVLQGLLFVAGLNWAVDSASPGVLHGWVLLSVSLPCWLYFGLLPVATGGTIGHRAAGLHLHGPDGERSDVVPSMVRAAMILVPFEASHVAILHGWPAGGSPGPLFWTGEALCYGTAAALIASAWLDRDGRGLHDRLTGLRLSARSPL